MDLQQKVSVTFKTKEWLKIIHALGHCTNAFDNMTTVIEIPGGTQVVIRNFELEKDDLENMEKHIMRAILKEEN